MSQRAMCNHLLLCHLFYHSSYCRFPPLHVFYHRLSFCSTSARCVITCFFVTSSTTAVTAASLLFMSFTTAWVSAPPASASSSLL